MSGKWILSLPGLLELRSAVLQLGQADSAQLDAVVAVVVARAGAAADLDRKSLVAGARAGHRKGGQGVADESAGGRGHDLVLANGEANLAGKGLRLRQSGGQLVGCTGAQGHVLRQ